MATTTKKLTERQKFERAFKRQFAWCRPTSFEIDCNGYYRTDDIFYAWEGWQASARVKRSGSKSGGGRK